MYDFVKQCILNIKLVILKLINHKNSFLVITKGYIDYLLTTIKACKSMYLN